MIPAVIDRRCLPPERRILVISDIHGNLSYLRALLEKAQYLPGKDVIILCGDMLEKGPQSLQTLRYIMRLAAEGEVYPLLGNCDGWHTLLRSHGEELDFHTRDYILHGNRVDQGPPLLRQMC
ncbi:MAG: metallophosphoesterase, partial [Oscillospiraceae bacterium]|nr:metallophosphoesterase [Oscillospiraceae bacterium]